MTPASLLEISLFYSFRHGFSTAIVSHPQFTSGQFHAQEEQYNEHGVAP
jgi:hypothetical protein